MSRRAVAAALVLLLVLVCAPSATAATDACTGAATPTRYDHVVWIFMENHHRGDVLGSPSAPFETSVAAGCATAADYRHVGRPSLPNYLGAVTGATWGVRDDAAPDRHAITGDNLFRQVRRAGGTARTYAESMPSPCRLGATGRYAVKHNPAAYLQGADDRAACQRDDLPLGPLGSGALATDLARGTLATFTVVVPDLCSDTHDCGVATGDRWLRQWITAITTSSTYRAGRTAVFVAWDEPTPMPFLAIGPSIRAATVVHPAVDHYALLRTTEDLLGLPAIGRAATAPSMRAALHL
jgi:phospholipase C